MSGIFCAKKRKVDASLVISYLLGMGYRREYELVKFVFLIILFGIAIEDLCRHKISNKSCMAIGALLIPSLLAEPHIMPVSRCLGALCVSFPMFVLSLFWENAFGGGDIKLTFVSGMVVGWEIIITAIIFAVFCGGIYGVVLLMYEKRKGDDIRFPKKSVQKGIAFAPFLFVGMFIAVPYAQTFIVWFLS